MSYEPLKSIAVHTLGAYVKDEVHLHLTEAPNTEANFACVLVEKWGMVMAASDGEDSAGRQRLRTMTPDEVAERAIATTEALFSRLRTKGWIREVPLPLTGAELEAAKDANEAAVREANRARREAAVEAKQL